MKFVISILFIIIIFAISIAMSSANNQIVTFNYLIAKTEIHLSGLIAILFGSGFIFGWILTGIFFLKSKLQHSSTKRKLNKLQKKYDEGMTNKQINTTKAN
ncbi:hypothetical protein A9G43_05230 [Gilliamella sp. Occ3-1]|uniref:LapA family protein n=1 Tax=Gilliamella sp. Occ3-1 TaxID=3120253 RepID=UPI00080ED6F7|nr:lipopolysaccharide assembly protein LapA domain-containing protein [Gilliamella apicola]OCG71478.1 hypothetical protein A9G43_05230 [Gilliamella apicola]